MPWIQSVRLRNYRSFADCTVPLRRSSVIIGANNVGKTSLLEAIESVLGIGRRGYGLTEDDLSRDAPDGAEILIDITIKPDVDDQFTQDEHAVFGLQIDVDPENRERLHIQARASIDPVDSSFQVRASFLKGDDSEDGRVTLDHRRALSVIGFAAKRDARRELSDSSGLWARITSAAALTSEQIEELKVRGEDAGRTIIEDLLGEAIGTEILASSAANLVGDVLYGGSGTAEIAFSAMPLDVRQLLRQIEIRLQAPDDGNPRPLMTHSTGTQAVLLLALFNAYTEAVKSPVVAISVEEPEVHLYPQSARALAKRLWKLPKQTLLTTHSTDVTDLADPRDLVVLRRQRTHAVAHSVPEGYLSDEEIRDIARRMKSAGSSFVFARAILLAEGPSEELALPIFASCQGIDLDSLGLSLVSVDGNSFKAFARLLHPDALGIPFLAICDNDAGVTSLVNGLDAASLLPKGVNKADPRADRALLEQAGYFWWTDGDFEACLVNGGAVPCYQIAIAELHGTDRLQNFRIQFERDKGRPPANDEELIRAFLRTSKARKPRLAQRVAELFRDQQLEIPREISRILEELAKKPRDQTETTTVGNTPA